MLNSSAKRLRIAFLVGRFPAISETFVLNQITGLMDRGHDVDIYAREAGGEPVTHASLTRYDLSARTQYEQLPDGLARRVFKSPKLLWKHRRASPAILLRALNAFRYGMEAGSLRLFYAVETFLPGRRYDIVHCHFGPIGLNGARVRELGAISGKLVTTFHGADVTAYPQRFGLNVYEPLFATGDLFLPVSERWKRRLVEMGCDEEKILVHHMGADCQKLAYAPPSICAEEMTRIVSVGRLVPKKGIDYGIRAVAKLLKENRNVEYQIVGDGVLQEELQRRIDELGIGDKVKLLGWRSQDQVREILKRSNLYLAPCVTGPDGDQEGIPVSIMEAMAIGLPVVSTRHSAIPELVHEGVSGFLVMEGDVDALAERLGFLVDNPPLWPQLGRKGRVHVEQHYNIEILNTRLVEIYHRLLG